jgi:hypothetical protein
MLKNPSLTEFEHATTMRVLLDRLADWKNRTLNTRFAYEDLLKQGAFAANDILKDIGINREAWVRIGGKRGEPPRAYLFHEPTHRIMAELGVVSDADRGGLRTRPRFVLLGRRGWTKISTIGDLVVATAKLGPRTGNRKRRTFNKPYERRNYGRKNY